jgi:hypothetical protein
MTAADFPTRVWHGIEAADPPVLRHDFPALLAMAEEMLATRKTPTWRDAAIADRGEREADLETLAFERLVANWRFIVTGEGEPTDRGGDHVLRAALGEALDRIAALAGERGGFPETLEAKAQAVIALAWHLEPGRDQVALARLTHQLRAEARAATTCREPAK